MSTTSKRSRSSWREWDLLNDYQVIRELDVDADGPNGEAEEDFDEEAGEDSDEESQAEVDDDFDEEADEDYDAAFYDGGEHG